MTRLSRLILMMVMPVLRKELNRIAAEKRTCIERHHDSDCGFQLMFEVETGYQNESELMGYVAD